MKKLILTAAVAALSFSATANTQLDFKSLEKGDLIDICSKSCGEDYAHKVEIRDFYQLKTYKDKVSQAGLTCFKKTTWEESGTPCHNRSFHKGIHKDGLAPTKTEVHGGSWATKQGGAWCIAYNEEDFPGMQKAINKGNYKPGQVACVSGMKLGTF